MTELRRLLALVDALSHRQAATERRLRSMERRLSRTTTSKRELRGELADLREQTAINSEMITLLTQDTTEPTP